MEKTNYKTMKEIIDDIPDRLRYSCIAEQLASLALTEFAEKITSKGATILSCSPKQIKLDNCSIKKVIGRWIKYTYDFHMFYYIQFDSNPFFTPYAYKQDKNGHTTSIIYLHKIFDEVNEYSIEPDNVQQLVRNLFASEKYIKEEYHPTSKKSNSRNVLKQEIYYNY